jgi:hypothetical protein
MDRQSGRRGPGFRDGAAGYATGVELLLGVVATVLVVAGIVAVVHRHLAWGVVLIALGLAVGPGGITALS